MSFLWWSDYEKYIIKGKGIITEEFRAGYIKALAQSFYGIPEFRLIKATGLDIIGADVDTIIDSVKNKL